MAKKEELAFKTIRIYEADHELLLKKFSRENNFAEIINIMVNKLFRTVA